MNNFQAAILAPPPLAARHLFFSISNADGLRASVKALAEFADGDATVVGLGRSIALALDAKIDQLRVFPAIANAHVDIPSTPAALWVWLRGDDRGEIVRRSVTVQRLLAPHL